MSYELTALTWDAPQKVDWNLVRDALASYLREVIATFVTKNPEGAVYGIVVERGQNWELSVYLNTDKGYITMPTRFRQENPSYTTKSDEELLTNLGRWYYHAWEFQNYEFLCRPQVNAINELHYRIFQRLFDQGLEQQLANPSVSEHFLSTCAEATALLE